MASGHTTLTNESFIRDQVYSRQITSLLLDDLIAMRFVNVLTEFPDGTTFNLPSLGEAETQNFAEGQAIKYNKLDEGNFTFSFDTYKYSANSISEKFKRDSFWSSDVQAAFGPRQHRALMEAVETDILAKGNSGQTASNVNAINNADHRWVGSGTGQTMAVLDFSKARYALTKANVPLNNLVAIVDPSVAYTLETSPNISNMLSPMSRADAILTNGLVTGFRSAYNFMGFDVYVSNYLPNGIAETVDGKSVTTGVANYFFSASPGDTLPIVGGFRQTPTVYSEFNKDLQQTEYLTIAEWGWKLRRPENNIVVLTDRDVV